MVLVETPAHPVLFVFSDCLRPRPVIIARAFVEVRSSDLVKRGDVLIVRPVARRGNDSGVEGPVLMHDSHGSLSKLHFVQVRSEAEDLPWISAGFLVKVPDDAVVEWVASEFMGKEGESPPLDNVNGVSLVTFDDESEEDGEIGSGELEVDFAASADLRGVIVEVVFAESAKLGGREHVAKEGAGCEWSLRSGEIRRASFALEREEE
jgi:hypothetical protein